MDLLEGSEPDPPRRFRRRELLALGSAGLLSPLFGNLAWAEPLAVKAATAPRPMPMSLGYIDGSEGYKSFKRLPRKVRRPAAESEDDTAASPVIVPAESLFQSDSSMPGLPLRVHVHGLYPPLALEARRRRDVPQAIDLEAIFPSNDPASPAPLRFFVWSLRQSPGWDPSPPTSFRFPLDWQVLPQFVPMFEQSGAKLPGSTQFLIDAGAAVSAYGLQATLVFAALVMTARAMLHAAALGSHGDAAAAALLAADIDNPLLQSLL